MRLIEVRWYQKTDEIRLDRERSNYKRMDEIESDNTKYAGIRKKSGEIRLDHNTAEMITTWGI